MSQSSLKRKGHRSQDGLRLRDHHHARQAMAGEEENEKVRLFVGQVPRSMTAEQLLAVLREAGRADGATLIRDRNTGASRGCCFVVCPSREEADKAIGAYHNKWTLPGASKAMQVKYADGELERLEHKLFVGMLPRSVKEPEVSALFSKYGNIRELKLLRSLQQTSKACAILNFESKEHARAAIEALNGKRVLLDGSNVTLVVKWADTEKERQARKAQKAQSQASNFLRADLDPQHSIVGAPLTGFVSPYNGLGYQPEGFCTIMDSELKDLMKMTNGKLEMLVTELKSVVKLLENRVPLNDPIPPFQHSHFSVEHDEKQYKPNECNSDKLELPGIYGHTKYPLQNQACYNTMYPHVNQGNSLHGLNTNIFPGTNHKTSNLIQSAGYIRPPFPALPGLQYPVSFPDALVIDRPPCFSYSSVNMPNTHRNPTLSPANTRIGSKIEGPPRANLFVYDIPQECGDEELANLFRVFGRVLSAKVFINKATGFSKCFGFVSYDTPASAQAAIRGMNGSQLRGKRLKVQLKRETGTAALSNK